MSPTTSTAARILLPSMLLVPAAAQGPAAVGSGNDLLPDPPDTIGRVALELVTIAPGPVIDVASAGDGSGRLFLVDPAGTIRILTQQGVPPLATPFLHDPAFPATRAMSSVAFHPDHAANGLFYLVTGEAIPNGSTPHYAAPQDETPNAFDNVLYEFRVLAGDPDQADPASKRELLRVRRPSGSHTMSDLVFGGDGYLYVSLGDGGLTPTGTPTGFYANGQDTTNPFGCVLRIDVDSVGPNGRYAIPPDNPFAGGAGGNVPELFAWGLRNPWRLGVDRATGAVWTGDNGDVTVEEVIRLERGGNYGWGLKEGSFLWDPITRQATPDPNPDPALLDPLAQYDHNHGTQAYGSIIGGTVYRGKRIPWLRGKYVAFDHVAAELLVTEPSTGQLWHLPLAPGSIPLAPNEDVTMGTDEEGELYVGRLNGIVLRLAPAPRHLAELAGPLPANTAAPPAPASARVVPSGWNDPTSLRLVAAVGEDRPTLRFALAPLATGEHALLLLASDRDPAFPRGTLLLDRSRARASELLLDPRSLVAGPLASDPTGAFESGQWIDAALPPAARLASEPLFAQALVLGAPGAHGAPGASGGRTLRATAALEIDPVR